MLDGKRFRFVGMNFYPFVVNTSPPATVRAVMDAAKGKGVTVFRTWCFDAGYLPSNSAGNFRYLSGGVLAWREATFQQLDMVLDEARQRGIRLILSLADNPTYNTKNTYIRWSDAIYGTDYFSPVARSVTSMARASNVVTVTTSAPHGYLTGNLVTFAGASPSSFNGGPTMVTVTGPTTFTYANAGTDGSATGTITATRSVTPQAFFDDANCRQMFKDFVDKLTSRVNTVNGRTYRDDDTIFAWELGNELRYDQANDPGINGTSSHNLLRMEDWIATMSAYVKSVDPNHLVSFSSMAHTWQFATGDTVSNGTFYGVDYGRISAMASIDYLDFHLYPAQGDNVNLQKYGQRLGAPNAVTRRGFEAQLRDFVTVGKANGKPVICGEIGFVKELQGDTVIYPLYPRHEAFRQIMRTFFEAGGDGMLLWSATTDPNGGTYSVVLDGVSDTISNLNTDDRPLMSLIAQRNALMNGRRTPVALVDRISP